MKFIKNFAIHFQGEVANIKIETSDPDSAQALQNIIRASINDYMPNGEPKRHKNQKLTLEQVKKIKEYRRLYKWGRTKLAKKFNVGKTTIERIINEKSWSDVE